MAMTLNCHAVGILVFLLHAHVHAVEIVTAAVTDAERDTHEGLADAEFETQEARETDSMKMDLLQAMLRSKGKRTRTLAERRSRRSETFTLKWWEWQMNHAVLPQLGEVQVNYKKPMVAGAMSLWQKGAACDAHGDRVKGYKTPSQCAIRLALEEPDCERFMFSPSYPGWGCSCCTAGGSDRTVSGPGYWSTYTINKMQAKSQIIAVVERLGYACEEYLPSVGNFATADMCAAKVAGTPGCSIHFMYSAHQTSWGCRCCKPGKHEGTAYNHNWDTYTYDQKTEALHVPTTYGWNHSASMKKPGYAASSCGEQVDHLQFYETPDQCALAAARDPECGDSLMFSMRYPSWRCRCCKRGKEYPTPESAGVYWDLYWVNKDFALSDGNVVAIPHEGGEGKQCAGEDTNLGNIEHPNDCARKAVKDKRCGPYFMLSKVEWHSWGCRCCAKNKSSIPFVDNHNWDIYKIWPKKNLVSVSNMAGQHAIVFQSSDTVELKWEKNVTMLRLQYAGIDAMEEVSFKTKRAGTDCTVVTKVKGDDSFDAPHCKYTSSNTERPDQDPSNVLAVEVRNSAGFNSIDLVHGSRNGYGLSGLLDMSGTTL